MTTHPHLRLTTVDAQDSVRIEAHGDLDHDSAGLLLREVTDQLSARPAMTDLHLLCAALGTVDSMGLSALLMIGRRTAAAGVRLHLDDRPAKLDRLLRLTGTLDHLTAPPLTPR
ncbi:STAS domain-containing protein [Streptomyces sp. P01-B04]|uniref:STAS domain-containing protein n=1 Tax=Streptomyces poriferorum TaxID=2798799 RepID=UPI001C5F3DFC|nr:STAS domain-containing protein [Streptomyces poriferorum]MBW5247950.1 STAS domain-containing protein [Streptomyces poriferorum]MBW5256776.1 STAS domain-containing protein [Streptomyces poriferorum]